MKIFTSDPEGEVRGQDRGAVLIITILSVLETVTFALLVAAMVTNSDSGVSAVGLVHGLLFAAYTLAVLSWRTELQWLAPFAAAAILTGPLGPVLAMERLRRLRYGPRPPRR